MICAAWSAGGAFLAAGSADHHVRVYHLPPGGSPTRVLETCAHTDAVDSLSWSHLGLRFVSGSKDGSAAVWSLHASQWRHRLLTTSETLENKRLKVTMVQWDLSDAYIVTAMSDCTIRVWCGRTCRELRSLRGHEAAAYVLEAHPLLPHVLLSAGHDGRLLLWHVSTGEKLWSFENTIEGQGAGAIFDAKWGTGTTLAASDAHGHLLLLGLGAGADSLRSLPTELFFHTDYRPLTRDALGGALDEQSNTPPHLLPPPFLVDVEGAPHSPRHQRTVPGRENMTLSQLIPVPRSELTERSQLDLMIDALRRQQDAGQERGEENALTAGDGEAASVHWAVTASEWAARPPCLVRIPAPAEVARIDEAAEQMNAWELSVWARELRRRPLMISTARPRPPRRPPRARPPPAPRHHVSPVQELEAEEDVEVEESSSADSCRPVRRRPRAQPDHSDHSEQTVPSSELSSYHSGVRSDNSSSSSSSQYSDWEAGEERLQPPRRRTRRPANRYSPSMNGPREEIASSVNAQDKPVASTSEQPELPEAYRPGEWLTAVSPRKAPYFPQMGDHIAYFRIGHQRYLEVVAEKDVYKVGARDKPWERTHVDECEPLQIVGIKYEIRPPRVARLKGARRGGRPPLTVVYHDMPDVIDFLLPIAQLRAAAARRHKPGDRFRCMIDDSWWTGTVVERLGPVAPAGDEWAAAAADYLALSVRWDNGELERLSPWDLEPIDPTRMPSEPGGAVPVLPQELPVVLNQGALEEWGPHGADACRTIAGHIQQVMSLSVAEPFVAPVDLQLYPSYARLVPYPVDLATIRARLLNLFYRRPAALQFDVRYLAHNAELFNLPGSLIARQARLLTALVLHVISNWEDVDVVAKYHELAATYQSDEDETPVRSRNGNDGANSWRESCRSVLASLLASRDAAPFRAPVPLHDAPDYHTVVSNPMDLGTVSRKLSAGEYSTPAQFATDVKLIFANSRLYNTNKRSRIYSMTVRLSALFAALWSRVANTGARSSGPRARAPRRDDSIDSDEPLYVHKGKGVGKKSKPTTEEPSSEAGAGPSRHNGTHSSGSSDGRRTRLRQGSTKRAAKRRRIASSASSDRPVRLMARERVTDGSSSSSPSLSPSLSPSRSAGARYESDREYRPYCSDDEPLQLVRQRQEASANQEPGPSTQRRRLGAVRLRRRRSPRRYNEQSEEEGAAAISKRERVRPQPALARALARRRQASRLQPAPDHTYYNGHQLHGNGNGNGNGNLSAGSSSRSPEHPVSISSRGRVRKLTAKARGLLRE